MNKEVNENWINTYIKDNPFRFKETIIHQCRQMDKADVYEWLADNEVKIVLLQQKVNQLEEENRNKNKMYERLLFQVNVCIRYIKNMDLTKKSTNCENNHYDFTFILATLKQGKGGSNE